MSNHWKAVGGTWASAGLNIREVEGHVYCGPIDEVFTTNPASTAGHTDSEVGNKMWRAIVTGHVYASGYIAAFGGEFSCNRFTADLSSGNIRKVWPLDNVSNHTHTDRIVHWEEGTPTFYFGLGVWVTGDMFVAGTTEATGKLTIKPGSVADKLVGTATLTVETDPALRQGRAIGAQVRGRFKNDVALTNGTGSILANDADGTLSVEIGSSGASQALSGAAKIQSILYRFDHRTGNKIPVQLDAFWNEDPVSA